MSEQKYEPKVNSGNLFTPKPRKGKDGETIERPSNAPDWEGLVNIKGQMMEISMWQSHSEKAGDYFSVTFREPYDKTQQNRPAQNSRPPQSRNASFDD